LAGDHVPSTGQSGKGFGQGVKVLKMEKKKFEIVKNSHAEYAPEYNYLVVRLNEKMMSKSRC
jgi:hypothetical protein